MLGRILNKEYLRKLPLGLIIVLFLLTATLYVFGIIVHETFWEKELEFDNYIISFVSQNTTAAVTSFMEGVTRFADAQYLQVGYGILILVYLLRKNFIKTIEIISIGIGGFLMNYFLKSTFRRTRPEDALLDGVHNFAFPSGHATSAFIFYGLVAYLVWKSGMDKAFKIFIAIVVFLFIILIGFSRVYLRVHYPTDVLAGYCTGLAWLLVSISLFQYLKRRSGSKVLPPANHIGQL